MTNYDLLLVNPPSLIEKPDIGYGGGVLSHTEISQKLRVLAMNPGILSIASDMAHRGYSVKIVDLSVSNNFHELEKQLHNNRFRVIGVSSTSGFDYVECLKCLELSKKLSPHSLTLIGGQHAGPLAEKVFIDTSFLDIVCIYEGENVVGEILQGKDLNEINGIAYKTGGKVIVNEKHPIPQNLDELPALNYKLYPSFRSFAPFIEESRGCYAKCEYCTSSHMNKGEIRFKSVDRILEQIEGAVRLWGKNNIYILSAATFGVDQKRLQEIAEGLKQIGIFWTTEFRADLPWHRHLNLLCNSGLKVAVVGMESASPEILLRMKKTAVPERYIESAEKIIAEAKRNKDLVLRLNLMFYIGETPETLKETLGFLIKNSYGIDAVLYTPVFVNPGTLLHKRFGEYEKRYGAKLIRSAYWNRRHLYLCHPSNYFSFQESLSFCDFMEKLFSSEKGWFESEKFHYVKNDSLKELILKTKFRRTNE